MHVRRCPGTHSRIRCLVLTRFVTNLFKKKKCIIRQQRPTNVWDYICCEFFLNLVWWLEYKDVTFWMMLCPICHVLMSDILIHLKGCAKTVPLHTTLPANPRYWLGADSKAAPVGLCTTQSQVNLSRGQWQDTDLKRWMPLIPLHMHLWFTFVFY